MLRPADVRSGSYHMIAEIGFNQFGLIQRQGDFAGDECVNVINETGVLSGLGRVMVENGCKHLNVTVREVV